MQQEFYQYSAEVWKKIIAHMNWSMDQLDLLISNQISKLHFIIFMIVLIRLTPIMKGLVEFIKNNSLVSSFIKIGLRVPILNYFIKRKLRTEYIKVYDQMGDIFHKSNREAMEYVPEKRFPLKELSKELRDVYEKQFKEYSTGKFSGTIYHSEDSNLNRCIEYSMSEFWYDDAFDYLKYSGMTHLNSDIVNMTKRLFNADHDTYAFTTSGGSESIISSIAAYKFWAKAEKGITKPNLVMYASAHAAFLKACDFMDIEARVIPLENEGEAVPERLHGYIDSNTIAVVASAWNFAHGTIDDIETIAWIAANYNVGCHVDNWLGGFVNWFVEYFIEDALPFDFRIRGVTSISADTHKYWYGPKGMSICMFRPKKLFDHLLFTSVDNSEAPFSMNHFGTNRSGSIAAGTWTALMNTGLRGYISKVYRIYSTTIKIRNAIKLIPELKLYSLNNSYNMVCFEGNGINPISVSAKLKECNNWKLTELMLPVVCHFLVMESNSSNVDEFIRDLKAAIIDIKKNPLVKTSVYQAFYGAVVLIKDESILDFIVGIVIDSGFETTTNRAKLGIDS